MHYLILVSIFWEQFTAIFHAILNFPFQLYNGVLFYPRREANKNYVIEFSCVKKRSQRYVDESWTTRDMDRRRFRAQIIAGPDCRPGN